MACRWPSHTFNDDLDISKDLESAFHKLVESCEVQLGHSFTKYVMSLLVASRFGLADFEILHILAADSDLLDEIKEEAEDLSVLEGFPYQTQLSRLLARIEPFLHEVKTEGETILKLSHETLKSVLRVRFLSDVFKHRIHSRLATFFQFTGAETCSVPGTSWRAGTRTCPTTCGEPSAPSLPPLPLARGPRRSVEEAQSRTSS